MMKKLLLADDSITIQKVVGIILSTEEYQLEITDDGDRAFTKALEDIPDLVIADISMPGKDGFELCRAIKSEPSLSKTSVLLLPGVFDHFDETKAGEVCADGWLTKPFESQALLDKISQLLEAEPVRMAGAALPEEPDLPVEAATVAAADQNTAMHEEVLGLDAVDDLAGSAEDVDEESPDDIWDAVSFAEEDLQEQVEPAQQESADEVSFAADVMDPSIADDKAVEPALAEPDLSTLTAEPEDVDFSATEDSDELTESAAAVDTEEFQPEPFAVDFLEAADGVGAVELGEPYEAPPEVVAPLPVKESDPVDFSVFSEDEDEAQPVEMDNGDLSLPPSVDEDTEPLELVDEPEDAPVSTVEETEGTIAEAEDILEPASPENDTAEEVAPFADVEAAEEPILVEQEEETLDTVEAVVTEETDIATEDTFATDGDDDEAVVEDEIIDLSEDDIVTSLPPEEATDEAVVEDVETAGEVDTDLEYAEETPLIEAEVAPVEEIVEPEEEIVEPEEEAVEAGEAVAPAEEETESVEEVFNLAEEVIEPVEDLESVSPPSEEETFYFDEAKEDDSSATLAGVASVSVDTIEEEDSATERVEQQLRELSEDELKDVVSRVAGPIIEKIATEMLEKIAWEVVPELAEAMISEEIRKIKEGE